MLILGIDTSGKTASVSICDENNVIAQTTVLTKLTHSQVILPLIEKLLKDAELTLTDIDGFAVANGPGSYTGLRIGISAVKAMGLALNKKCIGVSTLKSLAYNCVGYRCTIISLMRARPDIAYYGIFSSDGENILQIKEDCIANVSDIIKQIDFLNDIVLVGDYAQECFEKYFKDKNNVRIAPAHDRLQLSSSLCAIAMKENLYLPDQLDASYLQITKAEKDIAQKD